MEELLHGAGEIIGPLLGAGAGAAARDLAGRFGAEVADRVELLAVRIGRFLTGNGTEPDEVVAAVRSALDAGAVTADDVRMLGSLNQGVNWTGRDSFSAGGNQYIDTNIHVRGDFHG